jgi:hypothetical protein
MTIIPIPITIVVVTVAVVTVVVAAAIVAVAVVTVAIVVTIRTTIQCRSQWPVARLWHEMSSPAQTRGSRVRIPHEACTSTCVCVCVVLCK